GSCSLGNDARMYLLKNSFACATSLFSGGRPVPKKNTASDLAKYDASSLDRAGQGVTCSWLESDALVFAPSCSWHASSYRLIRAAQGVARRSFPPSQVILTLDRSVTSYSRTRMIAMQPSGRFCTKVTGTSGNSAEILFGRGKSIVTG